ncbi:hypothetical protein RND81_14G204400 [Saponaria officinalis]|uniref:Uncharacterized protein n=1 Tax=Saponaria officinalis TaxID=3572 RepID=A0AAW1GYE7_SAPOF
MAYHARTVSLPSTLHPVVEQLKEQLNRLRSSQSASTSSSLSQRFTGLKDLYTYVDEFLQLPQNQHDICFDESLDRSLRLLDICTISRDVLVNSKENLQCLQSVLRRRCSGELSIASEASEYLQSRKTAKKTVKKCLQSIKPAQKKDEGNDVVSLLAVVDDITVDSFKSLLSYIGGAEFQSTKSRWSVVAKLVHQKSENVESTSEFGALDGVLSLICQKKKTGINMSQMEDLRIQMVKLESDIREFDEVLECLYRHLVKTRASLLNIHSN